MMNCSWMCDSEFCILARAMHWLAMEGSEKPVLPSWSARLSLQPFHILTNISGWLILEREEAALNTCMWSLILDVGFAALTSYVEEGGSIIETSAPSPARLVQVPLGTPENMKHGRRFSSWILRSSLHDDCRTISSFLPSFLPSANPYYA